MMIEGFYSVKPVGLTVSLVRWGQPAGLTYPYEESSVYLELVRRLKLAVAVVVIMPTTEETEAVLLVAEQ
ncbi:MAG TPA: hypothetical protein VMR98_05655 [Candidatus Polarisedimenticolaceae bacterium]|nr:hypothetical protein [Candidatus Polarisedimenticolaceae bacterium]